MKTDLLLSIEKMQPNGKRLELPKEQLKNYSAVKKCLQDAGGKYFRNGFVFNDNAVSVQERLLAGEAINDKKKFQFFHTPENLAIRLVEMAGVKNTDKVLEPSAGQGAIANIVAEWGAECTVVELMEENIKSLKRQGYNVMEGDFLNYGINELGQFDKIIANPPFSKNQDIDHIQHMHYLLKPGGKLVSIASKSWTFGAQKKQKEFKEWLDEVGAVITDLPRGTFKESGTDVAAVIIEINN